MKTGIELIEQERMEQIEKHGFTLEKYDKYYVNGELLQAACFCLEQANPQFFYLPPEDDITPKWPKGWSAKFKKKIVAKSVTGKLVVAGAFFMAENDRIGQNLYQPYIDSIAIEIEKLNPVNEQDNKQ